MGNLYPVSHYRQTRGRNGEAALRREARGAMLASTGKAPPEAVLFADGGSRGNPGPAASGAVLLTPRGAVLEEIGEYLGTATNNVAEWTALCIGLEAALRRGLRRLAVRMDSELVVKQMLGEYRVKHADLRPLYARAQALLRKFDEMSIAHVPRRQNTLADAVVNRVLDQEASTATL